MPLLMNDRIVKALLPNEVEKWEDLNEELKKSFKEWESFSCKLHLLVNHGESPYTSPRISNLVVNNFSVPFPEITGTLQ